MADISDIDTERARRLRAKSQDPQAQRHEQEFVDWGNRLRTDFGAWDSCDPAATAILALVEAQNVLTAAISQAATGTPVWAPSIDDALAARGIAALEVVRALLFEPPEWSPARTEKPLA
jgi:hypothetical protein